MVRDSLVGVWRIAAGGALVRVVGYTRVGRVFRDTQVTVEVVKGEVVPPEKSFDGVHYDGGTTRAQLMDRLVLTPVMPNRDFYIKLYALGRVLREGDTWTGTALVVYSAGMHNEARNWFEGLVTALQRP